MNDHLLVFGDVAPEVLNGIADSLPSGLPDDKYEISYAHFMAIMVEMSIRMAAGNLEGVEGAAFVAEFETSYGIPVKNAKVVIVQNGLLGSGYGSDEILISHLPDARCIFVADEESGVWTRVK